MNRISLISGIRMLTLALSPFALLTPLMAGGCDGAEEPTGAAATALTAACVDSADPAPIGAWICGEDRLVECDSHEGAHVDQIYASLDVGSPLTCLSGTLTVSSPGPFLPGVHDIEVDVEEHLPVVVEAAQAAHGELGRHRGVGRGAGADGERAGRERPKKRHRAQRSHRGRPRLSPRGPSPRTSADARRP